MHQQLPIFSAGGFGRRRGTHRGGGSSQNLFQRLLPACDSFPQAGQQYGRANVFCIGGLSQPLDQASNLGLLLACANECRDFTQQNLYAGWRGVEQLPVFAVQHLQERPRCFPQSAQHGETFPFIGGPLPREGRERRQRDALGVKPVQADLDRISRIASRQLAESI